MPHVLACITQQHDIRLVLLAGLVCLLASLTAFNLAGRSRGASSRRHCWLWVTAAAIVSGSGVWATHFVAMLAYRPGVSIGYDFDLTLLSVGLAIAIIWLGCAIGVAGDRWAVLGGAVAGAGIGAMHYTGMAALWAPAEIVYDGRTIGCSLLLGIVLSACAFGIRERRPGLRGGIAAAAVFALAILSLHLTAMSAVTIAPEAEFAVPGQVASPQWLAVAVTAVTLMIIALSLAGSVMDQHLAERKVHETARLRQHVAELEATRLELEATGADLRRALDSAAASNRAKSQFLATMSHELRTPLNAVIGFAELIGIEIHGGLGDPRYRDYAMSIRDSGAHLLALINDVLDFAKIDAGRLELIEEEIDIPELFAASLRMVEGAAADAGLVLREDIGYATLPRLRGDQRRIKQILLNLLSNAIKFTPAPGVVTIAARRHGQALVMTVSDTGIGIAPADLAKALEPFGQIDNRLARAYQGTGLGLPLSRQLMEVHGGSLELDSEVGHGTTVTLTLPAERLVPVERAAPAPTGDFIDHIAVPVAADRFAVGAYGRPAGVPLT
jgi:signal transduction histidine kinase